jgi:hypothetical protein
LLQILFPNSSAFLLELISLSYNQSLKFELHSTINMRFSTIIALLFSSLALAAPVDLSVREAEAEAAPKPQYGDYGDYPAPSGGYGRYDFV